MRRAKTHLERLNLDLSFYAYPALRWAKRKWRTLRRPYSYFASDALALDLQAEIRRGYDVLHLEQTWVGWLGLGLARSVLSVHWLAQVDLRGNRSLSPQSVISKALMTWTERHIIGRCDVIRVLTPADARIVRILNPKARVVTIPLAIEPALYRFQDTEPPYPTVGLIGSMGWQPTRSATIRLLTRIWPRVKEAVKDARLLIVGWEARRALGRFLDRPDVRIVEDVPTSEPYFRELSVLAFPVTNGSGMKVKVLEAMAYGVPLVTTTDGIAGIEAVDGDHAAIADDDAGFAARVIELLKNNGARGVMRQNARQLLEERYSPHPVLSQMELLYEQMLDID